nr:putative reverse transcriptase, RNA-dependent DNA polymerase [Tanacetum cinerariifolium]
MMLLYGDGDLTFMKFIRALSECSSSPKVTISDICPNGQDISPLNPRRGVVAGIIWVSYPLSSPRVEKEISWSAKKLWVVFCLVILCQGVTAVKPDRFFYLPPQMDALICVVIFIPVKLVKLILVLVFCGSGHGWRCLELYYVHCQDLFWCLCERYEAILSLARLVLVFKVKPLVEIWSVTALMLVLSVYKVTAVFDKVNAAKSRVTAAVRVSTAGWIKWLEDQDMRAKELKIYSLGSTSGIRAWEYDLWLMRIEQYFLMTDYSLWEVIKNGNKVIKKIVGTVKQIYEPNSVEEKLERKNEMKARGTLLMALLNKDQLKFHSYQDAKLLIIKLRNFRSTFDRLQKLISRLEIQGSSSTSQNLQNMAFVSSNGTNSTSSTNEADNTAYELVVLILKMKLEGVIGATKLKKASYKLCINENPENVNSSSDKGYHAVPPLYTGNYIPPKPELMFIDEQVESESMDVVSNVSSSVVKTVESKVKSVDVKNKGVYSIVETKLVKKNNFSPLIIGDYVSDDESEVEFVPKVKVKTVRPSIKKIKFVKPASEKVEKKEYKEKGVIDSGFSRHMIGNKCYLTDYDGGFVSFGDGKGRISGKGKIKTRTLDFHDVYFCKELKYNLFSVSQMCDKKNNVLFTDTECLVLSFNFKLLDESQVLLRAPRKDNIYSVDLKSVVPTRGLTCLFAKDTIDESNLWHMRLGHINYKTMNKLMRGNLVRGIKREFSVASFHQHNDVIERKNITLIEAARTMLVDSKLPTTFWAEAVNTACYVLNRVLVIKHHHKTPYELIRGRPPLIDFMKPFGYPVTILNTRDYLGKFDEKADEGFFVRYSVVSKAMRVFNKRTMIVEEALNIRFLKNAPNVKGNKPDWLFDIDFLTISMNYVPVVAGFQTNGIAGIKDNIVAGQAKKKKEPKQEYILIPICTTDPLISQGPKDSTVDARKKTTEVDESQVSNNGGQDDQVTRNKWAIGTKWVFRNKKDERGIVIKNKARLVAQGHTQEEGIDYDEVFAPVARIESIRLFLAYASFKDFIVNQMDVNGAFLYEKIEGGYMSVNLVALRIQTFLTKSTSQEKYVDDILKKFDFTTIKIASTPMVPNKALVNDVEAEDVDVHLYRSMIGSLMYLIASRLDITFVVCTCARDSPFDLKAYSDSDYARASLDRKSTIGCCQFLGKRLISWQCKKQTIVANSTTKAEYVAAASYCGHVLWIQNQMLDYGFNLMNTVIYIDNERTICIVKNLVFLSKTKHIEIRHHFIRDSYEKKLIQVIKIHTDHNVADLLTKAFDEGIMERATTTASSLKAEQDSGNINRTQSMATLNKPLPQETGSGSGPKCQVTILGGAEAQTRQSEMVRKRIERISELKSRKRYVGIKKKQSVVACCCIIIEERVKAVRYALTVNLIVYALCVKQFWTTAKVKKVNSQEQIQALVDKQKIIITEESIIRDLKFNDAEGTACLPNDTIFKELPRIGAKTTAWNKFSSTMASAIICLANNQKFNFSKYIFDNMVKHLEGIVEFLIFLRFLQVFLDEQVEGMAKHKEIYVISSYTNKIKPKRKQRQATKVYSPSSEIHVEESIPTPSNDPLPSGEDSIQLNELTIVCINLQQVLDLEEAKTVQAKKIANLKKRVNKLGKRRKSRPAGLRRLKKVGLIKQVEFSEEKDSLGAQEDASKQGRSIEDIDQDVEIALVDEAQGRMHDVDMFGVDDLEVTVASVEDSVAPTTATTANVDDELTLAKTLIAIKAAKTKVISTVATTITTAITTPKAKGIVFHEQVQAHIPIVSSSKDKGKAKMIEPDKPLKIKIKITLDEEVARKLEAEMKAKMEEEERIAKNVEKSLKKTQAEVTEGSSKRARQELKQESTKKQKEDSEVLRSIVKGKFKKTKLVDDIDNLLFQTLKTMFEPHVKDIIWKYQQRAVKVNN